MADRDRLKLACEGKSSSQGGYNVSDLIPLAKTAGYTGSSTRAALLDFLCKPAARRPQASQQPQHVQSMDGSITSLITRTPALNDLQETELLAAIRSGIIPFDIVVIIYDNYYSLRRALGPIIRQRMPRIRMLSKMLDQCTSSRNEDCYEMYMEKFQQEGIMYKNIWLHYYDNPNNLSVSDSEYIIINTPPLIAELVELIGTSTFTLEDFDSGISLTGTEYQAAEAHETENRQRLAAARAARAAERPQD